MSKLKQVLQQCEEFEEVLHKELDDLEVCKWKEGGEFEEIRDLAHCENVITDKFKESKKKLIEAVIESLPEEEKVNMSTSVLVRSGRDGYNQAISYIKQLLQDSLK